MIVRAGYAVDEYGERNGGPGGHAAGGRGEEQA